jgi:hypothetical protein
MVYPDSQAHCYEILDEALRLIRTQPGTPDSQNRLSFLLLEYFQDDHATSADFRSTICYGRRGLQVTMDQFNKYVILPSSHYEFFREDKNCEAAFESVCGGYDPFLN